MAKTPKYFTVKSKAGDETRKHRVLGGANKAGTAAGAAMKSASQSNASKSVPSASKSSGPGGGMMGGTGSGGSARTAPSAASRSVPSTSRGPTGGSLNAPARNAPSAASRSVPSGGSSPTPKSPMAGQGTSYKSPADARLGTQKAINKSFLGNIRSENANRYASAQQSTFGPRAGIDKTAGTVTPSSSAIENTLSRIAAGSIVGNTPKSIVDRVPQDTMRLTASKPVNLSQVTPGTSYTNPNGVPDAVAKALAARGYNPDGTKMQPAAPSLASQYVNYQQPPSVGSPAYRAALGKISAANTKAIPTMSAAEMAQRQAYENRMQQLSNPFLGTERSIDPGALTSSYPGLSYSPPVDVNARVAPTDIGGQYSNILDKTSLPDRSTIVSKTPDIVTNPEIVNGRNVNNFAGGLRRNINYNTTQTYTPGDYAAYRQAQESVAPPQVAPSNINSSYPYGGTTPNGIVRAEVNYPQNLNRTYSGSDLSGSPYANAPVSPSRPLGLAGGYSVNPVYGEETPSEQTVREAVTDADKTPQYSPAVGKIMAPVEDAVANKFGTRVAPSQQDYWMGRADKYLTDTFGKPGPNSPYVRMMETAANKAGGPPSYTGGPQKTAAPTPKSPTTPPPPALQPLPPYVNYQQLPADYSLGYGGVGPSQPIVDFMGNYGISGGYENPFFPYRPAAKSGGRIGDGIDAAIRLAKMFS